jgi:tRNA threonylcarbamoyladenosine biosynthesis protein TsaB
MKVLAIECATEFCSVALWLDGELRERETAAQGAGHGENLLPLVDALLGEAGSALSRLDAIAVSRGPGAFTGVRLGISVAQGLAYAAGLPVYAFSTLQVIAAEALQVDAEAGAVLVCQDARMGEIYCGSYLREISETRPPRAGWPELLGAEALMSQAAVASLPAPAAGRAWRGAGSGFDAWPALRERWPGQVLWRGGIRSRAGQTARLAAAAGIGAALPPERVAPVYLRDDVAQPASRN